MTDPRDEAALPPLGRLLRRARLAHKPRPLSQRAAAALAQVSETTWRHTEAGSHPVGGMKLPYDAGDGTIARMARATGVPPGDLRSVGEPEAAEVLERLLSEPDDRPQIVIDHWDDEGVRDLWGLRTIPPAGKVALIGNYLAQRGEAAS